MARRRLGPPSFITDLPSAADEGLAAAAPEATVPEAAVPEADPLARPAPAASAALPPGAVPPAPALPRAQPRPPIASIAGQSAAEAALDELAADLRRARDEGRLVQDIPLEAVDESYLVRDRIVLDGDEMAALTASLRARGQQMPVELVELGQGRFGLISGWRRLTALRQLAKEDPARFGKVKALLRRPAGSAEAYRAMVEENEIRVGLSYYERARIAARAVGQGVFPDTFAALAGLFPTASRAKRSKIGSFIRIHDALDDVLRFPAAIPERLGLDLARALEEPARLEAIRGALAPEDPMSSAEEMQILAPLLAGGPLPQPGQLKPGPAKRVSETGAGSVSLRWVHGGLLLSGAAVDEALAAELKLWLAERGQDQDQSPSL